MIPQASEDREANRACARAAPPACTDRLRRVTPEKSRKAAEPPAALGSRRRGRCRGRRGGDRAGHSGRPVGGGVLRRRQHDDAGRQHLPPGPRAAPARVLHDPRDPRRRPGSRPTSGSSASRTPSTSPRPGPRRSPSSPATPSPSSRSWARRSSTRRWPTGSGPAPAPWPSCTSTRASGSGWSPRRRSRSPTIIARRLGLTGALGTVAEHDDGVYTGRLVGDMLHGPAKAEAIKALAAREGLDLGRCSAYSDSFNDLPMLVAGRRPVRDQPRRPAARARPRAGLADPRLPHRPQGRPGRRVRGRGGRRRHRSRRRGRRAVRRRR